jgi:hypothetical protein
MKKHNAFISVLVSFMLGAEKIGKAVGAYRLYK